MVADTGALARDGEILTAAAGASGHVGHRRSPSRPIGRLDGPRDGVGSGVTLPDDRVRS